MISSGSILGMSIVLSLERWPATRKISPDDMPRTLDTRFSSSLLALPRLADDLRLSCIVFSVISSSRLRFPDLGFTNTRKNVPASACQMTSLLTDMGSTLQYVWLAGRITSLWVDITTMVGLLDHKCRFLATLACKNRGYQEFL